MSAYPAGYIEQLARPFRLAIAGNDERTPRSQRGEQGAREALYDARHGGELSARGDTQTARR